MDEPTFIAIMETQLGGNLVDVELTPDDYTVAFQKARRVYQEKGNDSWELSYITLDVQTGVTQYLLTDNIIEIIEIVKPGNSFYSQNPFHRGIITDLISPIYGGNGGCMDSGPGGSILDYHLTLSYLESIDRITANDVMFSYNKYSKNLTLKTQPQTDETWLMESYIASSDTIYREYLWIQDWTLAELKIILGMAYRKFPNLDTPAGQESLPGADLIQEGNEMKEKLLQDIQDFVDGDVHTHGGIIIE